MFEDKYRDRKVWFILQYETKINKRTEAASLLLGLFVENIL